MLTALAAWPSQLTANPNILVSAATYDIEAINGVDHLVESGAVGRGDKLGHVYFEGEYGENALQGSKFASSKQGLTLVEQKIKATDTDLTGGLEMELHLGAAHMRGADAAEGLAAFAEKRKPVFPRR